MKPTGKFGNKYQGYYIKMEAPEILRINPTI